MLDVSVYRKKKHCSTCPFLDNGKAMRLNNGRVDDIKKTLDKEDTSFNCHKTVYSLNEDLSPSDFKQSPKMCYGAYQYLREKKHYNLQMRLAISMGLESIDE